VERQTRPDQVDWVRGRDGDRHSVSGVEQETTQLCGNESAATSTSITAKSSGGGSATRLLQLAIVEDGGPTAPAVFDLSDVSPNPTPRGALIRYSLGRESHVRLGVRDVQGREVALLVDGVQDSGDHSITWDGAASRSPAPAGIYFICLDTPAGLWIRRFAVLR